MNDKSNEDGGDSNDEDFVYNQGSVDQTQDDLRATVGTNAYESLKLQLPATPSTARTSQPTYSRH